MRKKLSFAAAALLAASVVTIGGAAPAHACHELTTGDDPVYNFVCNTYHNVPNPKEVIDHYYDQLGGTVKWVYCTLWDDPDCP